MLLKGEDRARVVPPLCLHPRAIDPTIGAPRSSDLRGRGPSTPLRSAMDCAWIWGKSARLRRLPSSRARSQLRC